VIDGGRGAGPIWTASCCQGAGCEQIAWLDLTFTQIEKTIGLPVGGIGIEAQIETPADWSMWTPSPAASPASRPSSSAGPTSWLDQHAVAGRGRANPDYPADPYHYIPHADPDGARTYDLQAIDGPFLQTTDVDGYREVASVRRARLRRQVGAATRPARSRERGVLAGPKD